MKRFSMTTFLVLVVTFVLVSTALSAHAQEVLRPRRTQGLEAPAAQGVHELVTLAGPGRFVSAQVTKNGGIGDLVFVILDIDGENVVNISLSAARNLGFTQSNPYGLILLNSTGDPKTLTIGFPVPLGFRRELKLSVDVQEDNVTQILANVIHGK